MRDKLQSKELQSAHTDMHNLSLKTKSPQVRVQNTLAENADVTRWCTNSKHKRQKATTYNAAKAEFQKV